ncbi:MAG: cobalamin-dependent protein [Desulfobacterales bacterium]|nr:cobalamin-dependent protein [Desulfobacterales bacterium]
MKKQKLLLLYPGDFYSMQWGRFLALKPHMVYMHSFLKPHFDVTVVDLENEFSRPANEISLSRFKQNALKRILAVEADVLAISCWSSMNYPASLFFAAAYKEKRPDTAIVVGGYHPTFVPEDFIYRSSPFDHVVRGEIHNIFQALGMPCPEPSHTYEIEPDFLGYPYYDNQSTAGLFLGSGCPFQCRYCMEYKRKWSSLPVETAISRILKVNRDLPLKYITIFDACFGLDRTCKRDFLKELAKHDLDIYFWLETRVDLVDETDIRLLSNLKVKMDLGIDSLSETMLGIMGKSRNPGGYLDDFLRVSRAFSKEKIFHDSYIILDHPGESRETWEEFKSFCRNRVKPDLSGGYLRIKYQRFSYYPGNHIYNHYKEYEEKYGFKALHPQWWKEDGDHYQLSREVVPSIDEKGKPYHVPLKEAASMVKAFNADSKEESLWKKLHSFAI